MWCDPGPSTACNIKQFKSSVRKKAYQIDKQQKKFIDSTLHGHFLQRYADAKVPPPGLRLQSQKKPETGRSQNENNDQWSEILSKSSIERTNTLIAAHRNNTVDLATQLATHKT